MIKSTALEVVYRKSGRSGARKKKALLFVAIVVSALLSFDALSQDWSYRVRPGDTLWELGDRFLHTPADWQDLLRYNEIEKPENLRPGMRLRIPVAWLRIAPAPARLLSRTGTVEIDPESAADPARLVSGTRIRTGAESAAVIEFADGSRMNVQSESEVFLDVLSAYGETGMVDTRMRLRRGRVESRVRRQGGPASRYIIDTVPATASVRGTEFRVAAWGESAVAEVLEGEVDLYARYSDRVDRLQAGLAGLAAMDRDDDGVRTLLAPPDLSGLERWPRRRGDRIRWPDLPGAVAYRVLIDSDLDRERVLYEQHLPEPSLILPAIDVGDWQLRVRGIDSDGVEGLDARVALQLLASPEPPFPLQPDPGAVVAPGSVTFVWSERSGVSGYRLQVAKDEAFEDLILDRGGIRRGQLRSQRLAVGRYWWRVAVDGVDGRSGPFGDAQALELRDRPASPSLQDGVDGRSRVVRWRAGAEGQRYGLQIARDPTFTKPVIDLELDQPQYLLRNLRSGQWYLRVRTIDPDGFAGEFGEAQLVRLGCLPCRVVGFVGTALLFAL